jgi:isochorismate synthase
MTSKDFFNFISEHYEKELPFVAYSKPNTFEIKAILQKDKTLYKIDNYEESGFVFSPFDVRKDTILIPYSMSRTLVTLDDVAVEEDKPITFETKKDKEHHINLINKGIDAIYKEALLKVVLSRKETITLSVEVNPLQVFKSLLNTYNSAFVYCWYHPNVGLWLGATPETLLEVEQNRFSTMALAGTQDYLGTLNVVWDDKEKQEQQFVTDYVLDNLKSHLDNLELSKVKTLKAGQVLHLKTDISGLLKETSKNLQNLIFTMHPTPAICGLPKVDAMQFILDNEHYNREFYTGFLGELNKETKIQPRSGRLNTENKAYGFNKRSSHLFVNLRCMQLQESKAILYVGGGITKDSNPENEWRETVKKAETIKNVLSGVTEL